MPLPSNHSLDRFLAAQQNSYFTALQEISAGKKRSHWMWYIFPQIQGLGFSEMSKKYAIRDLAEATAFLQHPELGKRLIDLSLTLLGLATSDAYAVFGSPDDMKLNSSMTLFASVPGAPAVFNDVLEKFFGGRKDPKTLQILSGG